MAIGLIPSKKSETRGHGICKIQRGPNRGKTVSCAKGKGGKWRKRKPLSELSPAGRAKRKAMNASKQTCRKEKVSQYGNVRCMTVCRKGGKVTSRKATTGCSARAPRSRIGKVKR